MLLSLPQLNESKPCVKFMNCIIGEFDLGGCVCHMAGSWEVDVSGGLLKDEGVVWSCGPTEIANPLA